MTITILNGKIPEKFEVEGVMLYALPRAREQSIFPKSVFSDNNTLFLYIPKNVRLEKPLHFLYQNNSKQYFSHHVIIANENSELTLLEEYQNNHAMNVTTEIYASKNARVHFAKIQNENSSATHDASLSIHQQEESVVNVFSLSNGARSARELIKINLHERGAECILNGFYPLKNDEQKLDYFIDVNHHAKHTRSEMLYKGILDKKSKSNFRGKVFVHQAAKHITAHQSNHHLLLSKEAEAGSKPELEIYADDVKCTHGATVGQIDPDALFYLRARGLDEKESMKLLTAAFAADVLDRMKNNFIKNQINMTLAEYCHE